MFVYLQTFVAENKNNSLFVTNYKLFFANFTSNYVTSFW